MREKIIELLNESWDMKDLAQNIEEYTDDVIEATMKIYEEEDKLKLAKYAELENEIHKMYEDGGDSDLSDIGEATLLHFNLH